MDNRKNFLVRMTDKYPLGVLLFLVLATGLIAFFKFFTVENLFFFKDIGSDSLNQIYPATVHKYMLLKENFFFKYSFYTGMGDAYVYAMPYDPLGLFSTLITFLGFLLSGPNFMVYYRFHYIFLVSFIITSVLFYFYGRTVGFSKITSVLGSYLLVFSGYMVVGSTWGFSGNVLKIVAILFAFEQLFVKKRWYFFPFAVAMTAENSFLLYIYSLFLFLYIIFRYLSADTKHRSFKDFFLLLAKTAFLGLIGILIAFHKFVSGLIKLYFSPRVSGSASYSALLSSGESSVNYSSHDATLILRTFSSDILGTGSDFHGWYNYFEAPAFYIGLLTLVLFPLVFTYLTKRDKYIFGGFLFFWLATIIFPYLRFTFLAYTGDYYRYGFDFFIPFVLLFYAMKAFDNILSSRKINLYLLAAVVIVLLVALFFPYSSIDRAFIDTKIQKLAAFFIILYAAFLYLLTNDEYRNFALVALLVLIFIEVTYFSYKSMNYRDSVLASEFEVGRGGYNDGTPDAVAFLKLHDKTKFYRVEKDYSSGKAIHNSLNDAMVQGYFGTTFYSSFNQLYYIRFQEEIGIIQKGNEIQARWSRGFREIPLLMTFGNVKYFLSKSDSVAMMRYGYSVVDTVSGVKILKNNFYLPFGYTYDAYIDVNDFNKLSLFQKQLVLLYAFVNEGNVDTVGLRRITLTDTIFKYTDLNFNFDVYRQLIDRLRDDTLQLTDFHSSHFEGKIDLDTPKVLFFSIPYDEAWKVSLDGKHTTFDLVNLGFSGIYLGKGKHTISAEYVPAYSQITFPVALVSALLFWTAVFVDFFRRRKGRE